MKTLLKIAFLFCFLIPMYNELYAQKPITCQRYYDGGYNLNDFGYDICKADQDNFYLIGSSSIPIYSINNRVIQIFKINKFGDTIWTRKIGAGLNIEAYRAVNDNSGGCILTGQQGIPGAFFISIDKFGNINWQRNYGSNLVELHDIIKTNDNGYVACGMKRNVNFDGYIIKIDSSGNLLWQRELSSKFSKVAYGILENSNSDLIICGNQLDTKFGDITKTFISKTDSDGNIIWTNNFRISNKYTSAYSISILNNGYIVCGETLELPFYSTKVFFAKINLSGELMFLNEFQTNYNE